VIGKVLPYLVISLGLILMIVLLARWHFRVNFHQPAMLAVICVAFLLCSLGLGLVISAISKTQTQAIQFSVFFLLPVFILSGAFAPLDQLPIGIRYISELFPLTHFCRAFRLVNLYHAAPAFYLPSVLVLLVGTLATFAAATVLLRRIEE
jgi:ABC-2 type transport system permease protein